MSLALAITNLSKTYPGGVQALKSVSLQVPAGMFGLLGPNGAGKSTLMRTLATLQEPDAGAVSLGPLDVLRKKDEVRKVLGYLPQEFGVYPRVSAEAMLNHLAVLKGLVQPKERKEIVAALLQRTNLYDVRSRKLGTFSGGMKQRFGIAQALLGDPKLVIVDEPTAGLDPAERLRFHNLLSEIGENVIVILSTHIVEDVSDLCTRMAILSHGSVLLSGETQAALDSVRGRIWKKAVPKDAVAALESVHQVISTHLVSGRTVIHVLADARPDVTFDEVPPDLEDVYFSTLRGAAGRLAA